MVQRIYKQQDLKLAFFFNNKRGIKVLKSLRKLFNIQYVFLAKKNLNSNIIKYITEDYQIIDSLKDPTILDKIRDKKINLIISAGFPYIFDKKFFNKKNKIDILNLHGGPVPRYRGGSPLVWQRIEGKNKIGISIIKTNLKIDSGKLMGLKFFSIKKRDNIKNIYEKAEKLFCNLLIKVIKKYYLKKNIKINSKKLFPSKYYYQRKPEDSLVRLSIMTSKNFFNFHKALVPLYEPPFLYLGEKKIFLLKIKNSNLKSKNKTGLVEKIKNKYYLNLKDKKIRLIKASINLEKIKNKFLKSDMSIKDV